MTKTDNCLTECAKLNQKKTEKLFLKPVGNND